MKNTKFVKIIHTFSKEEWISYRKYLLMHTVIDSDNYRIFEFFQKRKNRLDSLSDTVEIHSKYFSDMSHKSMLNVLSRLFIWAEEWLVYSNLIKDKREINLQLVKLYNRRGLFDLADQKTNHLAKSLTKEKSLSLEKSRISTQLLYNQYYSDNPSKFKKDILSKLAKALLKSQADQKLLIFNELLNMNSQSNIYDDLVNQYYNELEHLPKSPEVEVLQILRNIISDHSANDFYILKDKLLKRAIEENSDLEIILCNYLFNYSFILITMNKLKERTSPIEIANFGLENNLLTAGGSLSPTRYINIVSTLAKVNDYPSTMEFINKWSKAVITEDTESLITFSKSTFFILNEQYDKIPLQPILLHFKNVYLKMHSISIYLISEYSNNETDYAGLYDTIRTLKRTLFRYKSKLNSKFYTSYFNFIKVIILLIEKEKIDLEKYNPTMHKNWIINRMESIKKVKQN